MSFGTFASRYGAEPKVDMDLGIEADHPFTFAEGLESSSFEIPIGETSEVPPAPTIDVEKGVASALMDNIPDIPWSIVAPAGIIGVIAIGVAWFLTRDGNTDIPI